MSSLRIRTCNRIKTYSQTIFQAEIQANFVLLNCIPVPRATLDRLGGGAGSGQVEEVVGHEPLPEVPQAAVAHPRVALQGQALEGPGL